MKNKNQMMKKEMTKATKRKMNWVKGKITRDKKTKIQDKRKWKRGKESDSRHEMNVRGLNDKEENILEEKQKERIDFSAMPETNRKGTGYSEIRKRNRNSEG